MGRYDFRPLHVHRTMTQMIDLELHAGSPAWLEVVGRTPPAQILVRTQPLQFQERSRRSKPKKSSKLFRPNVMTYEEDQLRRTFFADHPWELARPRMVLETDGKDEEREDWSQMSQPRRPLSGESVVRRQVWLRENEGMGRDKAYDQARKEFYELRLREEIERRVAHEEALATGAYFGKSALEVGMELEDKEFERYKQSAQEQSITDEQKRAAMYTGDTIKSDMPPIEVDKAEEAGLEDVGLEDAALKDTPP